MTQASAGPPTHRPILRARTAALVFGLLAILHTWPMLPLAGSALTRSGGDDLLNAWMLTAVVQGVLAHPFAPFDVNMYYPYTQALAGLDHQLSAVPITAPVWLLTGNPLLVANLFTMATFALAGFLTARLVADLSGSAGGALIAGCIYAFATMRFDDLGHTHLLGNCWLPLSLLAVHRYARLPTWPRMWQMTGAFLVLALASWYLAIIGSVAVAVVGLAAIVRARQPIGPTLGRALAGMLVIGLVLGSAARVYIAVTRSYVSRPPRAFSVLDNTEHSEAPAIDRTADSGVMLALSAPLESYLAAVPSSRAPWLAPFQNIPSRPGLRFFPGAVAAALALAAFVGLIRRRLAGTWVVWTYVGLGAIGVLLSFGPEVHALGARLGPGVYPAGWPPFSLLRMPARFSVLFLMSVAVLAGFGWAVVSEAVRRRRVRHVLLAAGLVLVNAELAAAPLPMEPLGRVPQAYLWLRRAPPGPTVEFPNHGNEEALYWSLYSQQPIANGYGLVEPAAFQRLKDFDYLSPEMLAHVRAYVQPRYVVINTEKLKAEGPEHTRVLEQNLARAGDQLRLVGHFGARDVFEVGGPSRGPVVLRAYRPWMLRGKHAIAVRARLDAAPVRGQPVLQVWGNGTLLGSKAPGALPADDLITVPLPSDLVGGLELEVMADYRLPASAAAPIGRTGRSIPADILLSVTPERTRIEVNGHVWIGLKGYTVVALSADGLVAGVRAFNTSWSAEDSHALAAYLRSLPPGSTIAVASAYDASRGLTEDAIEALSAFGMAGDLRGRFGWAHAAVGVKGAPRGSALESIGELAAECRIGEPAPLAVVVEDVWIE
jgi:hypothetical protein